MTDRPIIFSAPMVRALLDGRKTQTRRLAWRQVKVGMGYDPMTDTAWKTRERKPSPWQDVKPGDRLWLRETHSFLRQADQSCTAIYRADFLGGDPEAIDDWRPAIHMPRWASRLTLVVTEVRRQRLQEISEQDAIAEGIVPLPEPVGDWRFGVEDIAAATAREAYARLWVSLHGAAAWAENPEVVALTFSVHRCNVDAMERAAG